MSILKIKNSNNHWVNIPSIKGDKGDKGDPGEVSQADLDEAVNDLKADLEQLPYGNYSEMTVGSAEQLLSTQYTEDKEPYLLRSSGGSVEVGTREEDVIVGGTVCWNQLALFTSLPSARDGMTFSTDDNKSITINGTVNASSGSSTSGYFNFHEGGAFTDATKDHVFVLTTALISGSVTGNFVFTISTHLSPLKAQISVGASTMLKNIAANPTRRILTNATSGSVFTDYKITINLFDLTQMFGTTIANAVYAMEKATAGAGVAWFKSLFPNDYYAYDAGTLKSVEGLQNHNTIGFNQWDEEWEIGGISGDNGQNITGNDRIRSKNYIPIIPKAPYYLGYFGNKAPSVYVCEYDASKNFIQRVNRGRNVVRSFNCSYIRFFLYDGTGITTYNHEVCINLSDPTKNGTYEPYDGHSYPLDSSLTLRGIPKLDANNRLYYDGDKYLPNGTVERRYGIVDLGTLNWSMGNNNIFFVTNIARANGFFNLMCSKYVTSSVTTSINDIEDKAVRGAGTTGYVYIRDTNYNNAADFKTAMSGIMLVYELATPTTETAQSYKALKIVNKYGTEEYAIDSNVSVPIPVGHETKYLEDLRGELETLIATKDKTVTVSGTTPTITGKAGIRYICGEVSTLSITAPESGCIDVVFTSGSTPTVLTVTSAKTGVTAIKWMNGFDPTSLDADTIYEVNILDGELGVAGSWT